MQAYILDENKNAVEVTMDEWAIAFDRRSKRVDEDKVEINGAKYYISTVFLGLDHNFSDSGPPLIFETMIFPEGSWGEIYCERYSTYQEAEEGHAWAVQHIATIVPDALREEAEFQRELGRDPI